MTLKATLTFLFVAVFSIFPNQLLGEEKKVPFKLTLENSSPFKLSPGGYVVHGDSFALYTINDLASLYVEELCESGGTYDFLFYVRKEQDLRNAFSFVGGAEPEGSNSLVFHATPQYPYLSGLHKLSFADDTCLGFSGLRIFDSDGKPRANSVELAVLDIGTRKNLRTEPPKDSIWNKLNPKRYHFEDTVPREPIGLSKLVPDQIVVRVKVEPFDLEKYLVPTTPAANKPVEEPISSPPPSLVQPEE